MTMRECAQNDRGEYVILRSGPVILRSGAFPPCHSEERRRRRILGACFGTGEKILRCAQNDNGGAQNNRAAVAPAVRPASR